MGDILLISAAWIAAAICYLIMKKIQPESSKLYLVYVLISCALVITVGAIRLL